MNRALSLLALVCACGGATGLSVPSGLEFEKTTIDSAYRAEGVAIFDVDRDGQLDLVTDQYWYGGPSFTPHEIRTPETYDPATGFADSFAIYPEDIDGDGWVDIIVAPHPTNTMLWYRNPQGADVHWTPQVLAPAPVSALETPIVADLFGDGRHLLVMTDTVEETLGYYTPPTDPTLPWVLHPIYGPGFAGAAPYTHGIGVGDVNGDGRLDVLTGFGWFSQTSDPSVWTPHAYAFAPDKCSRMFAYDFDGDGLADVLCSRPHDYGIFWFQQLPAPPSADPTFAERTIDLGISEMHALRLDDLDGDGVPEIISGKRWWAEIPMTDPGERDPPILVYYSFTRTEAGPAFVRHEIDGDSGIGTQFSIADFDGDGKPDIAVSNKKGLFYFHQR